MSPAVIAERVRDLRRVGHELLVRIDLAVEDAQRCPLEAVLAILAELTEMRPEIILQHLAVARTAVRAANGVEAQLEVFQPQRTEQVQGQHDDLGIDCRILLAQGLDAELVEFTHASGLWTVIAEHGADVEQLRQRRLAVELVLQIGAHRRGRVLGTQCYAASAAVGERIHFLVHDVRALADAAVEQLRMLEHRRTDLLVAIAVAELADLRLNIVPLAHLVRQYVLRTARGIRQ